MDHSPFVIHERYKRTLAPFKALQCGTDHRSGFLSRAVALAIFQFNTSLSEQLIVRTGSLVQSTKIAICFPAFNNNSRPSMISRKIKLLVAAASLVALATTVGLAGTRHTHASLPQTQGVGAKTAGASVDQNGSPRRGILTCGSGSTTIACEQLEMLLPMSARILPKSLTLATAI
jgi:hypothetical protein